MSLRDLTVRINADTSGFGRGLKSISSGIKSLAKTAAALAGVTLGVAGLVQAFKSYVSLESSVLRVNDLFKESAKYIEYFAAVTGKSLGMAESSAYEFAATYGNLFKNITKDTAENAKVTIAMLKASSVVASKTGRTMEDVMFRIRSGLLGNTEAIDDLGIEVKVAMLEVSDAFKQISNGRSWEQLTFYEQQQIRTLAILEQADKNFGNEVQTGSAYSLSVLSGAFKDLMSTAGAFINKALQPIIAGLTKITQAASSALKALAAVMGLNLTGNSNSLKDGFSSSADSSADISDNMTDTVDSAKALKKQLAGFDELNILASDSDTSASGGGTSSSAGGSSVFDSLPELEYQEMDIDTSKMEGKLGKIKEKLKPVTEELSQLREALKPFASTIGEGLKWLWDNALKPLGSWTINKAVPAFLDLISNALLLLNGVLKNFKPLGSWLWDNFLKPLGKWTGKLIIKGLNGISSALKKLKSYTPAITGLVAAFAAFKALKLLSKVGAITKIAAALATLKAAILPIITGFEIAGGGFSGFIAVITAGFSTALASFKAFMAGLSPIVKLGATIVGVAASFTTAFTSMYQFENGSASLGETLKNLVIVIAPVGIALTAMLGPVGIAITAVSALAGAIAGATKAVDDNIFAVSQSIIYNEMGTPISEYADTISALANTISKETANIISLGDTIDSNNEDIVNGSDELKGLVDRITVTGDMSEEMAEKISSAASKVSESAQSNITNSTNGIIEQLGKSFEDTAKISNKSTDEIISNLYLLEADGNKLIADTNKEITDLAASMVNMEKGSSEFSNAQKRLSELSTQLFKYTETSDTTVESADSLIRKLQELDASKIDWESETAVNEAMNTITSGYASSMSDLDSASSSALKIIDNQVQRYKNMGLLDEEGERMFEGLKNGIVSGYENQKKEITQLVGEKMNEISKNAVTSFDTAFLAAEQEVYNSSFGGYFKHLGTKISSAWNGKDFEDEMSKKIEKAMDNSVRDGVNEAIDKFKSDALMYNAGKYIPEGLADGIKENTSAVVKPTKDMANQTTTTTKKELDEHSPSKVFYKLGKYVVLGFSNGIKENISVAVTSIKNMCLSITSNAKSELQKLPEILKSTLTVFTNQLKAFQSDVINMPISFEEYFNNILNKANNFKSDFLNTMWNVRNSLENVFYNINVDCWNFGEELNYNLKNALNLMITRFNTAFQSLNFLNKALSAIPGYSLHFEIPEIPALAKGGVVTKPTTALIGEAGKEAVMPLENNTGWIDKLAAQINQASGGKSGSLPVVNLYMYPNSAAYKRDILSVIRTEKARGGVV